MPHTILKYPRTPHLSGSRLQPGDEDLTQIPFTDIAGRHIVIEEKIDGANSAVSFDTDGTLLLQSRGHYLTGGGRERHFDLMKQWAAVHKDAFFSVLGTRYIMYGEWMYAKHTIFYDILPHYFMEFDIYDRENGIYLDTHTRHKMLHDLPVLSVPVLAEGKFNKKEDILAYLGDSNYKSKDFVSSLIAAAQTSGVDAERVQWETDLTPTMEGLYLKLEENGRVVARLKYVRNSFMQSILQSESHWLDRPIIQNGLSVSLETLFDENYGRGRN